MTIHSRNCYIFKEVLVHFLAGVRLKPHEEYMLLFHPKYCTRCKAFLEQALDEATAGGTPAEEARSGALGAGSCRAADDGGSGGKVAISLRSATCEDFRAAVVKDLQGEPLTAVERYLLPYHPFHCEACWVKSSLYLIIAFCFFQGI